MKNLKPGNAIFFLIVIFLFSCKKEDEILPVKPVPINISSDQVSLIKSQNSFALDIFKKVIENTADSKNVILSPLSISSALSMALNGAAGATRDSMMKALRINGLTPEIINASYKTLTEALLKVDSRVIISIANSVWTENNFVVKKPFTDVLKEYYDTEAKSFDINDPNATDPINTWIELKTNGLIKNMISSLDDNTVMLLVNAIYFKGKWNSQFDKSNTIDDKFQNSTGESLQVPMMKQESKFKTFRGDGFSMAEFPYGQGNYVMDVILPNEYNGIKNTLLLINNENLNDWLSRMSEGEIKISFPRFRYSYNEELKSILSDMGMGVAFSDFADFSNISDMDLLISHVLHQAYIETNEEGTEAAAATVVEIGLTSAGPQFFYIDHPFIYIIRETTTNSILFMGRVANPLSD